MKILPFLPEDLEDICLLENKSFPANISIPKEQLCSIVVHSDVVSFCLKDKEKMVGYIILRIEKIKCIMSIISLAIEEEYRRKGWATKIITFTKEVSKAIKLDALLLQIEKTNKDGIAFFSSLGFQNIKEFENYLYEGQLGCEMRLDLSPNPASSEKSDSD